MDKTAKFLEPCKIDWDKAREVIHRGIDDYLKVLKAVKKVDISFFENWKCTLFEIIEDKIKTLSERIKLGRLNQFLMILYQNQNLK